MRPRLIAAALFLSLGLLAQRDPTTQNFPERLSDISPADVLIGAVPDRLSAGPPLTVRKNGATPTHLDLGWGDSCGPDQNDFAVYEGTLGTWYSHAASCAARPAASARTT